jgi:hypothetical protein
MTPRLRPNGDNATRKPNLVPLIRRGFRGRRCRQNFDEESKPKGIEPVDCQTVTIGQIAQAFPDEQTLCDKDSGARNPVR